MKLPRYLHLLFRRSRSEYRYHTAGSQALALLQQVAIALFLLSGWQHGLITLIVWAIASIGFCMFIQSQMVIERPSRRGIRRLLRELEVLASIGTAVLIVVFSGSATNLAIAFLVYVVGGVLTFELHGRRRRWLQAD